MAEEPRRRRRIFEAFLKRHCRSPDLCFLLLVARNWIKKENKTVMPQESRNTFSPQEGNLCFLFICNKKPSVSFHYAHVVGSFSSSTKREGEEGIQAKTPLAIVLYDTKGTVFFWQINLSSLSHDYFSFLDNTTAWKSSNFLLPGQMQSMGAKPAFPGNFYHLDGLYA